MDSAVILQAIADGAVNYIHKGDDSSEIITIIETALAGDSPISPSIANKVVTPRQNKGNDSLLAGIFPNKAGRKPQYHAEPKQKAQILSPRELEVLNLISFAIYRDLFPIFTWYIVPPRTIESTTVGKSSIREDACQYPFAEINWWQVVLQTKSFL